jgi:hypothetical protein
MENLLETFDACFWLAETSQTDTDAEVLSALSLASLVFFWITKRGIIRIEMHNECNLKANELKYRFLSFW